MLEEDSEGLERLLAKDGDSAPSLEDIDLVARVLSRLSPEHRLILTLREMQGLSYEELTSALDCSLDAVKSRLRRARESFEKILRHILKTGNV